VLRVSGAVEPAEDLVLSEVAGLDAVTLDADDGAMEVVPVAALIEQGEGSTIEFKSTLRRNLHTDQHDVRMENSCLTTIAAFLDSDGGTLLVGVDDHGSALGVAADDFENEDRMQLHLASLIKCQQDRRT